MLESGEAWEGGESDSSLALPTLLRFRLLEAFDALVMAVEAEGGTSEGDEAPAARVVVVNTAASGLDEARVGVEGGESSGTAMATRFWGRDESVTPGVRRADLGVATRAPLAGGRKPAAVSDPTGAEAATTRLGPAEIDGAGGTTTVGKSGASGVRPIAAE